MAFGVVETGVRPASTIGYQAKWVYDGGMTFPQERWDATIDALVDEIDGWRNVIPQDVLSDVYTGRSFVDPYPHVFEGLQQDSPDDSSEAPQTQQTPEYCHYAPPQRGVDTLLRLMALGGPIITACGQSWTPKRMPERGDPVCPECAAIHDSGQTRLLWIRRNQPDL